MLTDEHLVVIDNREIDQIGSKIFFPPRSLQSYYGADRILARDIERHDIISVDGNPCKVLMSQSKHGGRQRETNVQDLLTGEKKKFTSQAWSPVFRAKPLDLQKRLCKKNPMYTSVWAVRSMSEDEQSLLLVYTAHGPEQRKSLPWPLDEKLRERLRMLFRQHGEQTSKWASYSQKRNHLQDCSCNSCEGLAQGIPDLR